MTVRVTVNEEYQIVVPDTVRDHLNIKRGDHLLVEVRDGYAVLIPEPRDFSRRLRGLHREIWEGVDPEECVRREREAWNE